MYGPHAHNKTLRTSGYITRTHARTHTHTHTHLDDIPSLSWPVHSERKDMYNPKISFRMPAIDTGASTAGLESETTGDGVIKGTAVDKNCLKYLSYALHI